MICRETIEPSEVREDFFYEQCFIQVFNGDAPGNIFSAPCKKVTRSENELQLDFDGIGFDREMRIDHFRVIGADGAPICDRSFDEFFDVNPKIMMVVCYIIEWDGCDQCGHHDCTCGDDDWDGS